MHVKGMSGARIMHAYCLGAEAGYNPDRKGKAFGQHGGVGDRQRGQWLVKLWMLDHL